MAPHSRTLAWNRPWAEEPGGLQSMGSLRVGHDWATSLSLFTFMHWRRKWQPTPVFLPGESQGQRSLVGCSLGVAQSQTWLKRLSSSSPSLNNYNPRLPRWSSGWESACQWRGRGFELWSRKIPHVMGLLLGPTKTQCNHINMKKKKEIHKNVYLWSMHLQVIFSPSTLVYFPNLLQEECTFFTIKFQSHGKYYL